MRDPEGQPSYQIKDRRWWVRDGEDEREPAAGKPTLVASLEAELAERDRQVRETRERYHQMVDEMDRARARIERDAQREVERQRRDLLVALVPVVDDLDRALAAARGEGGPAADPARVDALVAGVELVRSKFLDRLRQLGVERDEPGGQPFDPARHEAVSVAPVEPARDGLILATLAPGYRIGDEVLRPARVVVGKGAPAGPA